MSRNNNFSEDYGYVNIHGQDIKVYVSEKTGEILVPIDEVKEIGFRIYRKSQYSKLLIDEKQFNNEFNLHMLQSAQSYMLQNKVAFRENEILESINKCKLALTGNQNEPKKDNFTKNHVVEYASDDSITAEKITANLRQPHTNFKDFTTNKNPESSIKLVNSNKYYDNGLHNNDRPKKSGKLFSPNQSIKANGYKGYENKDKAFRGNVQVLEKKQTDFTDTRMSSRFSTDSCESDTELKKSNSNINKLKESQQSQKIETIELNKQKYNVLVSFIEKPNCVWIQDLDKAETILEIDKKIQEEIKKSKKEYVKYVLNKVFLAPQDGVWFRCKIIKYKPLTVFFLDYGNSAQVTEIRNASEELREIPAQAVRVTFNENAYQAQNNDQITIKIIKKFDSGTYQVHIEKADNTSDPVNPKTFFIKPQPLSQVENNQKVLVISQNKGVLALRNRECYDKVKEIEKLLDDEKSTAKSIDKVEIGQLVLYKNDKLQRAVILSIDKLIEIELLDYYQTLKVDLNSLRHITENLAVEPLTYILTPVIKNYSSALDEVIEDLMLKKSKCCVVLNDDGFDIKSGEQLISQMLQSQETLDRPMIHQFKIFQPKMGVGEYMFNCYHSKGDVYFSPQDALQDYIEYVIITELEDSNPYEPIINEVSLGYYQGSWSRCVTLNIVNSRYQVRFIDFGNEEFLSSDQIRKLINETKVAPILAFRCQFTGLPNIPNVEECLQAKLQDGESYMIDIKKFTGVYYEIEIPSLYETL